MKTPEELANEWIETYGIDGWSEYFRPYPHDPRAGPISVDDIALEAFLDGYAAAQRWIPVEEAVPKKNTWCLTHGTIEDDEEGNTLISLYRNRQTWRDMDITHWQPLPPLPTK